MDRLTLNNPAANSPTSFYEKVDVENENQSYDISMIVKSEENEYRHNDLVGGKDKEHDTGISKEIAHSSCEYLADPILDFGMDTGDNRSAVEYCIAEIEENCLATVSCKDKIHNTSGRGSHFKEKQHVCGQCGKIFTQSGSLKEHKRLHSGEKPYVCEQCGVSFAAVRTLTNHKRTHMEEKQYICDQCGTKFIRFGYLTVHMRLHRGEKPYICGECGKSFSQSGGLIEHKRIHSGEKPYVCDFCNKCFARTKDLSVHRRIHTGQTPYKCELCGSSFSQSGSLSRHKRSHSRIKP